MAFGMAAFDGQRHPNIFSGWGWRQHPLNRFDPTTGTFTRYLHDPEDETSLSNNKVMSLYEDSRGTFYVGTLGDGLHTMDREAGTFTRHRYDPSDPTKLSHPGRTGFAPLAEGCEE